MIETAILCVLFTAGTADKPPEPPAEPMFEGRPASQWVAQLRDKDAAVRKQAADALEKIGPAAVPALLAALDDTDKEFPKTAAAVLKKLGPAAEAAAADLDAGAGQPAAPPQPVGEVRCRMAGRAAFFHPKTEWVVPVLLAGLKEADKAVRSAALEEFGRMAFHGESQGLPPGAEAAVPALAAASQGQGCRRAADGGRDLGRLRRRARRGRRPGRPADRQGRRPARRGGAVADQTGPAGQIGVGVAGGGTADADPIVRGRVAVALVAVDPEKAPAMLDALRGKTDDDRRAAAWRWSGWGGLRRRWPT